MRELVESEDLNVLGESAERVAGVLRGFPGAVDVKTERIAGLPYLRIDIFGYRSSLTMRCTRPCHTHAFRFSKIVSRR
jgi:hypothetical protein